MDVVEWIVANWAVVALCLLVADKVVAATPCKWDDLLVTAVKGALRQVVGKRVGVAVVLPLAALISLNACALKTVSSLPPHEQARAYVDVLMDTYVDVEGAYLAAYADATPARKAWLGADVGTALNAARHAIVVAGRAAHAWGVAVEQGDDTGAERARFDAVLLDARKAMESAAQLWDAAQGALETGRNEEGEG